jgi:hypothetical protein
MKKESFNLHVHMVPQYLKSQLQIPKIQREGRIWTLEQKQNLIDSLYNEFDIPKLYFRKDSKHPSSIWWVIDGQQRLNSICDFIKNVYPLPDVSTLPSKVRGSHYEDLDLADKEKIIGRVLDCVIVECVDDEEEDMFLRLNNGTPLSSAEKRNAVRGKMRDMVASLARHTFFKSKVAFPPNRFAHDAVAAQIVATYLAGEPTETKGKSLMSMYRRHREDFPRQSRVQSGVNSLLSRMNRIFKHKEPYMKKYNVVSIFLFLNEILEKYTVREISDKDLFAFLQQFELDRNENAQLSEESPEYDSDLGRYQTACVDGPDKEESTRIRHQVLLKRFLNTHPDIELKDNNRSFSEDQKRTIYLRSKGRCAGIKGFSCPTKNTLLPFEDAEFDHIQEYSRGGRTSVANGQLLCKPCHREKTVRDQRI